MRMRKGIALIELIFAIVVIALVLTAVPNLIGQSKKASKQAITQEAIGTAASEFDIIMSSFWDENATDPQKNYPILKVSHLQSSSTGTSGSSSGSLSTPSFPSTSSSLSTPTAPSTPGMPNFNFPTAANLSLDEFNQTTKAGVNVPQLRRVGSSEETSRKFAKNENSNERLSATPYNRFGLDIDPSTGLPEATPDDVDDFNNKTLTLIYSGESTTAAEGDYKDKKIQLKVEVGYVDETPTDNTGAATTFNNNVINFNTNLIPIPASFVNNRSTNIKEITLTLTSQNDPSKKIVLKSFVCNIGAGILQERIFQ